MSCRRADNYGHFWTAVVGDKVKGAILYFFLFFHADGEITRIDGFVSREQCDLYRSKVVKRIGSKLGECQRYPRPGDGRERETGAAPVRPVRLESNPAR